MSRGPEGYEPLTEAEEAQLHRLQVLVSQILRLGVTVSSIIVGGGLLYYLLVGHSGYPPGGFPRSLSAEWQGILQGRPYAIILLGLLVLMATPVARVVAEVVVFLRDRSWKFLVLASFALAVLVLSFALGQRV
jgi:uncharacterized membrane protein